MIPCFLLFNDPVVTILSPVILVRLYASWPLSNDRGHLGPLFCFSSHFLNLLILHHTSSVVSWPGLFVRVDAARAGAGLDRLDYSARPLVFLSCVIFFIYFFFLIGSPESFGAPASKNVSLSPFFFYLFFLQQYSALYWSPDPMCLQRRPSPILVCHSPSL